MSNLSRAEAEYYDYDRYMRSFHDEEDPACRCMTCSEIAEDLAVDAAVQRWKEERYEQEQTEPDFDQAP